MSQDDNTKADFLLHPDDCAIIFKSDGSIHVVMSMRDSEGSRVSREELADALSALGITHEDLDPMVDEDSEDEEDSSGALGGKVTPKPSGGHLN